MKPRELSYAPEKMDDATFDVVASNPGIKREGVFLQLRTSIRSVERSLNRLKLANKIEYRGSRKTGGWYVRT